MLNLKSKILLATFAVAAGAFGIAPASYAGEGAAAGAVSFTLTGGAVTSAAVAAAVGSNDAGALSWENGATNNALAAGSAGVITIEVTAAGAPTLSTAGHLLTNQANALSVDVAADINATSGTLAVGGP